MPTNLLIVESPNKIKKLQGFLGSDWLVGASAGHIRDIPGSGLGLDRDGGSYAITYNVTASKANLVAELKAKVAAVGKANVWLATDPDREGEGISFHLCEVLGLDRHTTRRVTFTEITEAAVKAAIRQPRTLDLKLVAAQEARRAIDRLVGWEVSPALSNSQPKPPEGTPNYSAGRVQSVAARLVSDREDIIAGFAAGSGLTFPVSATLVTASQEKLPARYVGKSVATEAEARALLTRLVGTGAPWRVLDIQKSPVSSNPPPAYSTSSLQIDGVKKLKFSVPQITELAQKLYENGHVSYIRTDSVNIGEEGTAQTLMQITKQYGAEYAKARKFKEKAGVQGGHEAIRPTHWEVTSAGNTPEERALYQLIYTRTLASQMSAAEYEQTIITLGSSTEAEGQENGDRFESRVRVLTFPGYRAAYQEAEEEGPSAEEASAEGDEGATLLRPLQKGEQLSWGRIQAAGRMQKPPKRFDQATLVKELEDRQIGRPSTYSKIIEVIQERQYVKVETVAGKKVATKTFSWEAGQPVGQLKETARTETLGSDKGKFVPTERGRIATKYLETYFGELIDYSFTANCEARLDEIAEGQATYQQLLTEFDQQLLVQKAEAVKTNPPRAAARHVGDWHGLPILARTTKFGPSLRYGPVGSEVTYNIRQERNLTPETITLEQAVEEIEWGKKHKQREIGQFEKKPILAGISGKSEKPYMMWNEQFIPWPEGHTLDTLTPDLAIQAIVASRTAKQDAVVISFDKNWNIYRRDDGGLMLTNGKEKCQLKDLTQEDAAKWTLQMAKDKMKRVLEWRKNNPLPRK